MADTVVYVVMDGNYEPSLEAVFDSDHEDAARRYAAALRSGYYHVMPVNQFDMADFPYIVDYSRDDDTAFVSLALGMTWVDEVAGEDGIYRVFVRAGTHDDAERIGREKTSKYIEVNNPTAKAGGLSLVGADRPG